MYVYLVNPNKVIQFQKKQKLKLRTSEPHVRVYWFLYLKKSCTPLLRLRHAPGRKGRGQASPGSLSGRGAVEAGLGGRRGAAGCLSLDCCHFTLP